MRLSIFGPGVMLRASRHELRRARLDPDRLSPPGLRRLIRAVLAGAALPLPLRMEVQVFPGREEFLFFILPFRAETAFSAYFDRDCP